MEKQRKERNDESEVIHMVGLLVVVILFEDVMLRKVCLLVALCSEMNDGRTSRRSDKCVCASTFIKAHLVS